MKLKFAVPMTLAAACLAFAGSLHAAPYTETGDAGDLPASAQIITGVPGVDYTSIDGATTATSGRTYDSDMFEFTIGTAETITFSTDVFVSGANDFDTQLFVFDAAGVGLFANDDAASGGELSTLTVTLTPGNYFLLLSGSGRYPVDSTGALIFPNFNDGTTDSSMTVAATSTLPIAGHTGSTNEGGPYSIAVTVPEPGTCAFVLAGTAGLGLVLRRARQRAGR